MKHRVLGLALAACAAAEGAEPATSAPVPAPAAAIASSVPKLPESRPRLTKPLDLRIRDVRHYMMPDEYRAALGAPDADKNTVVVQANRELLPVKFDNAIPGGLVAPIWAIMNPKESWRILLPDLNRKPSGPPDLATPPLFRLDP